MRIYFEVPYGYKQPDANGKHGLVACLRKGDYMKVIGNNFNTFELRVQKVCFDNELHSVTITLVEED